jgi:hypothetical protein
MQQINHNVFFLENRHLFRRKLAKIAENGNVNIGVFRKIAQNVAQNIFVKIILFRGKSSPKMWVTSVNSKNSPK